MFYYQNNCRPSVKDLLLHEFFQEDLGLKVEFVNKEDAITSNSSKVELLLRLLDPKKRQEKHKENEAIQFEFDWQCDNCDEVAQAMVGYVQCSFFSKICVSFIICTQSYVKLHRLLPKLSCILAFIFGLKL